jgi:hypothetical protein
MTKVNTCSCGNQALPGRRVCSDCKNRKRREQYAINDDFRSTLLSRAKDNYDPENHKKIYHYHRRKAFEILGGYTCNCCGFDDPRALQIDHVGDDGYLKRKAGELGQTLYRRVIRTNGEGFQVLCANCNWIKKAEFEGRTLEYYWEEESGDFKPRAPTEQCIVDPQESYSAFQTDEAAGSVATRLHVSVVTLRKWWVEKFGEESVRSRARLIQAKAVKKTGLSNRGYLRKSEVASVSV